MPAAAAAADSAATVPPSLAAFEEKRETEGVDKLVCLFAPNNTRPVRADCALDAKLDDADEKRRRNEALLERVEVSK